METINLSLTPGQLDMLSRVLGVDLSVCAEGPEQAAEALYAAVPAADAVPEPAVPA
jgi:hypothetical protein